MKPDNQNNLILPISTGENHFRSIFSEFMLPKNHCKIQKIAGKKISKMTFCRKSSKALKKRKWG